jgi:hypothetical protein
MRKLTLAIAAVLACAALPAPAQDSQNTPTVAPPSDAQGAPAVPSAPSLPNPAGAQGAPKSPSSTDNVPALAPAPSAAETAPEIPKAPSAAEKSPPVPPSRYSFNRVDNGFLRLDNKNGHVAYCTPHTVGWACQAVPEDRAALDKEISRLQEEIASLKSEVAALRAPPPPPRPPAGLMPPKAGDGQSKLLTEENVARARAAIAYTWRRLVDMIVTLQKDMLRKG